MEYPFALGVFVVELLVSVIGAIPGKSKPNRTCFIVEIPGKYIVKNLESMAEFYRRKRLLRKR
jgi:hypothetical protein